MMNLSDARAHVLEACALGASRPATIESSLGTVLAADALAADPVPPFANSAMDGYAVRSEDTREAPVTLTVVGSVTAGDVFEGELGENEALRLMTGAPVPAGADAVCMLELTEHGGGRGGTVVITVPVAPGQSVRRAGDDVGAGEIVFARGTRIGPAHLGVLVSAGVSRVDVIPPPRVGVLATGDELTDSPGPLPPGTIRDSNRPALLARLAVDGFTAVDIGTARDDLGSIVTAIDEGAAKCDAIVTIGGVSVGDRDFLATALQKLGAIEMTSMQIAIKPAKPFAFGVLPEERRPVFGLPGNPVSALVSYELLVRPALRKMAGRRPLDRPVMSAVAREALRRELDGKTHFVRVRAELNSEGRLEVCPLAGQGSHQLRSLADSNALAVLPDGDGVAEGSNVTVLLLDDDELLTASEAEWIP